MPGTLMPSLSTAVSVPTTVPLAKPGAIQNCALPLSSVRAVPIVETDGHPVSASTAPKAINLICKANLRTSLVSNETFELAVALMSTDRLGERWGVGRPHAAQAPRCARPLAGAAFARRRAPREIARGDRQ